MSQNETSGTVAVDNQKIRTKQMVLIALMTAVTCVLGPLSIPLPFSPVPISLTNFAIFLAIFVLGMKSKRSEEIQGILLWTLPDIERRLWIYGADDIDV